MNLCECSYESGSGVTLPNQQAQRFLFLPASAACQGKRKNAQKNGTSSHRSSRLLRILSIDYPPTDNSSDNLCGSNLTWLHVEDILRKDDQVGELADLELAFRLFAAARHSRSQRIAINHLLHRQSLLRHKARFMLTL